MEDRRHPVSKPIPAPKNHAGWIDYWRSQLQFAIESYHDTGLVVAQEHAVRSAHMLHWHAVKWKPALKPPRGY
jgi:hypothetical protein